MFIYEDEAIATPDNSFVLSDRASIAFISVTIQLNN